MKEADEKMIVLIIALLVGILIGLFIPISIPQDYSSYVAVGLLAALDSIFGALKSNLKGDFKIDIFISGFVGNTLIAMLFAYMGDMLGIPLYQAAVVAFGVRIFQNFGEMRRSILIKNKSFSKEEKNQ